MLKILIGDLITLTDFNKNKFFNLMVEILFLRKDQWFKNQWYTVVFIFVFYVYKEIEKTTSPKEKRRKKKRAKKTETLKPCGTTMHWNIRSYEKGPQQYGNNLKNEKKSSAYTEGDTEKGENKKRGSGFSVG